MLLDWQGENTDWPLTSPLATRRGLNVVLVARDKVALEQLAEEVRAEDVQAKVVVEDFALLAAPDGAPVCLGCLAGLTQSTHVNCVNCGWPLCRLLTFMQHFITQG